MSNVMPFPVRSRLTPQEREEMALSEAERQAMQCDSLGCDLVRALELEFADPEFLKALSQEQRERMEQTL